MTFRKSGWKYKQTIADHCSECTLPILYHIAQPAKGQGYGGFHLLYNYMTTQNIIDFEIMYPFPALLNWTHPLHTDTGQLIEMVCSVVAHCWPRHSIKQNYLSYRAGCLNSMDRIWQFTVFHLCLAVSCFVRRFKYFLQIALLLIYSEMVSNLKWTSLIFF